jgi:hypothetical protein
MLMTTMHLRKPTQCLVCGMPAILEAKAVLSPWIRQIGVNRKRTSNYYHCKICDLGFFDYRYTSLEMGYIYSNYRGDIYTRIRNQWEPWYSHEFNSAHDSISWSEMRKQSLKNFLERHLTQNPTSIVDVGGDRGQYIPNIRSENLYVLEASNKALLPGVERIENLGQLDEIGLIIYSHVLEHVSDPLNELKELLSKSNFVYVEVPFGIPVINKARKSRILFFLKFISSFYPRGWKKMTHPSTGRSRVKGILTQSEHLNFFSAKSLEAIGEILDSSVQIEVNEIQTPDNATAKVIQCLFVASK